MNKYSILFIAIILTALCCGEQLETKEVKKENHSVTDAIKVKTTTLQENNGAAVINAMGIVMSSNEARPAFKTGGVINKTYVKEGDYVKKGQLLATLLMNEINAQVQQAEEALSKAERDYNRVKNLHADSVATLEQLQNTGTALEVSKRNVEIAKFNRQYSEVRSPISGKVAKQIMNSGEVVGPGNPIYAIIGTDKTDWKVMVGLTDRDWARVKTGDKCEVSIDAYPDKIFKAVIKDKSAIGGNANGNIDVELKLLEQPTSLAAGLITKVNLHPSIKSNQKLIPIESLESSNGKTAKVYVVNGDKATAKTITIGKIIGDFVEVISGLNAEDKIVTTGVKFLEEGDKVVVE